MRVALDVPGTARGACSKIAELSHWYLTLLKSAMFHKEEVEKPIDFEESEAEDTITD